MTAQQDKNEETAAEHETLFGELRRTLDHGWALIAESKRLMDRMDAEWVKHHDVMS